MKKVKRLIVLKLIRKLGFCEIDPSQVYIMTETRYYDIGGVSYQTDPARPVALGLNPHKPVERKEGSRRTQPRNNFIRRE